ncbi:TPM domain-containing protein, partial [Holdemanella porci]|uniref:TPM domain-containing protein n=1 Tax=Holdemanella porci TaxID=2652276 RepID=UPI002FDE1407
MKKLSILCSSLLLALMMCFPVFASEDLRYVEDNADLLTVTEEQQLNDTLTEISERQGVDVAVITTDDMGDHSIKDYAKAKYNERGYGDDGA